MGEWSFTETYYLCPGNRIILAVWDTVTYFAAFHFGEVLLHGEICFGLVIFRGEMMSICYINSAKNHIWV